MLQVTADVFSGRPNPTWVITDEAEVRATLRELAQNRSMMADASASTAGLGYRGIQIESLSDETGMGQKDGLPSSVYIPVGSGVGAQGSEIALRLINQLTKAQKPVGVDASAAPALDEAMQRFLQEQIAQSQSGSATDSGTARAAAEDAETAAAAARAVCTYDTSPYNPGFWNNDATIRYNNNCYNYASNRRTNTFAQPGRGCGSMYTTITCPEMTRAALCDGLHRRYDCFPDSEKMRYLVALVVAPGPGFVDFHWYRLMREGYWAHKPGGTAVRNVDNSGIVIANPATCNRGPYTLFCGYFYTKRTQLIN